MEPRPGLAHEVLELLLDLPRRRRLLLSSARACGVRRLSHGCRVCAESGVPHPMLAHAAFSLARVTLPLDQLAKD